MMMSRFLPRERREAYTRRCVTRQSVFCEDRFCHPIVNKCKNHVSRKFMRGGPLPPANPCDVAASVERAVDVAPTHPPEVTFFPCLHPRPCHAGPLRRPRTAIPPAHKVTFFPGHHPRPCHAGPLRRPRTAIPPTQPRPSQGGRPSRPPSAVAHAAKLYVTAKFNIM